MTDTMATSDVLWSDVELGPDAITQEGDYWNTRPPTPLAPDQWGCSVRLLRADIFGDNIAKIMRPLEQYR